MCRNGRGVNYPVNKLAKMNSQPTLDEYLLIWENTNDAIFMLQTDGSIIQANPAFTDILGWTIEEVEDLSRIPFFMDNFTQEEHETQLDILRSGTSIPYFETKRKHKNGTIKDILASYRSINKGDVLAVAMYKDITDEKMTKQMLQMAESCYRALVEYSPDAIIVQSGGKMSFANPEAIKMFGASEAYQIIGKSLLDFIEPNRVDTMSNLIQIFQQDEMLKMEPTVEQLVRLDGQKIWVEVIAIPVQYENEMVIQAILRDVTVRKYYEDQLTYMATHDPMTEVVNRSTFIEELDKTIEEANITQEMFALLFIDLDKFKEINDSFGHGIGDTLLIQFAKRMKEKVRHRDVVGRIGGDEFLILLRDIDKGKVEALVKRMHDHFSQPYLIKDQELLSTSSIGIAMYPVDGESSKVLMQKADNALYKAKEQRNHIEFHST